MRGSFNSQNCRKPQSWTVPRLALTGGRCGRRGRCGRYFQKTFSPDSQNNERVRKVQIGCSFKSQTCTRPQSWAASRLALTGAEGAQGAGFLKNFPKTPKTASHRTPTPGRATSPLTQTADSPYSPSLTLMSLSTTHEYSFLNHNSKESAILSAISSLDSAISGSDSAISILNSAISSPPSKAGPALRQCQK